MNGEHSRAQRVCIDREKLNITVRIHSLLGVMEASYNLSGIF